MALYDNYTTNALTSELANVKKLKTLVNEMTKSDNFTYIDIVNLHQHLQELENYLREVIKERGNESKV